MFDGEAWLYIIPLMAVIVVALGLRGSEKKAKEPRKKPAPPPVVINGVKCLPEDEKKKDEKPKPHTSAFGVRLE